MRIWKRADCGCSGLRFGWSMRYKTYVLLLKRAILGACLDVDIYRYCVHCVGSNKLSMHFIFIWIVLPC